MSVCGGSWRTDPVEGNDRNCVDKKPRGEVLPPDDDSAYAFKRWSKGRKGDALAAESDAKKGCGQSKERK